VKELSTPSEVPLLFPYAYASLKLVFLPRPLSWPAGAVGVAMKPEPEILGRLRAHDVDGACQITNRRLRASGFVPMPGSRSGGKQREIKLGLEVDAARLAAALLFPVYEISSLAKLALRSQVEKSVGTAA
jgi:CRISPR-associated protein Csx17